MFHCLLLILFVVVFIPVVYHLSKHKLSTHAGIHLIFSCLDFKYGSVCCFNGPSLLSFTCSFLSLIFYIQCFNFKKNKFFLNLGPLFWSFSCSD